MEKVNETRTKTTTTTIVTNPSTSLNSKMNNSENNLDHRERSSTPLSYHEYEQSVEDGTSHNNEQSTATTTEQLLISTNDDQQQPLSLDRSGGMNQMNHTSIHNQIPSRAAAASLLQQLTKDVIGTNTIQVSTEVGNNFSTNPIGLTTPPYHHNNPNNRSYLRPLSINSKFYSSSSINNNIGSQSQNEVRFY